MEIAVESSLHDHVIPKTPKCKKPKPSIPYIDCHSKTENSSREEQLSCIGHKTHNYEKPSRKGNSTDNTNCQDSAVIHKISHESSSKISNYHVVENEDLEPMLTEDNVIDADRYLGQPVANSGDKITLNDKGSESRMQSLRSPYFSSDQHDTVCMVCHDGGKLILCDHCPSTYHLTCINLTLSERLHQMLGSPNSTNVEELTWTLIRSGENDCNMNEMRADTTSCLSHASELIKDCVLPALDPHYKTDMVDDIIFNSVSILKRLDFRGFYVMILQDGDKIISTGTLRIYGQKVAEMPLACTQFKYRGQGMFRLLLLELQKMLTQLGVERLVVPATPAVEEMWETSFGFTQPSPSERLDLKKYPLLNLLHTKMFQKVLNVLH